MDLLASHLSSLAFVPHYFLRTRSEGNKGVCCRVRVGVTGVEEIMIRLFEPHVVAI